MKVEREVYIKLITIKELENAGVGVIREELVKKTIRGKIYNANLYRNDQIIKVTIMYYNRGGSKLIDLAEGNEADSIEEYISLLREVIRLKSQKKAKIRTDKELRFIRGAMAIGYLFTGLNILSVKSPKDAIYIITDIILLMIVRWLYKNEGKRYEN